MSEHHPIGVALENRLMGQGIYVLDVERTADTIALEYEVVVESPRVTSHEVGVVVRTLLDIVDERDDWVPKTLEATSHATDGSIRGTWFVKETWFRQLHDELSEIEFSQRVLATISKNSDNI